MATFAERLTQALRERNMTAAELSRITGISEGMISQYKSGAYVAKQKKLELFSTALDVSIPWLMGQNVPMNRNEFVLNNNSELTNNGVIGQVNGDVHTERQLSTQEQDLLRIYNLVDGKTQTKIMNFLYEIEEQYQKQQKGMK